MIDEREMMSEAEEGRSKKVEGRGTRDGHRRRGQPEGRGRMRRCEGGVGGVQRRGGRVGTYKPVFGRVYENLFFWTNSTDPKSGFHRAQIYVDLPKMRLEMAGAAHSLTSNFWTPEVHVVVQGSKTKPSATMPRKRSKTMFFLMWRSLYFETHFVRRTGREAGGDEGKGDDDGGRRVRNQRVRSTRLIF